KAARDHNLTPSQFSVLDTLYAKGKMRIQDLTDRMLATSGNMTVIIRNMERDGLITRVCDPSDRRSFLIELTALGRETIEAIYPEHVAYVKEALSVLDQQDKEDLIRILKKFKNLS
ncbi:MarR family transcriptional regulator, partial [Streptococcus danieliae]|nr:MarR family transcriptional regulator [Streptococcus danieliae]